MSVPKSKNKQTKEKYIVILKVYLFCFPTGVKVGDQKMITTYKHWHCLQIYTHTQYVQIKTTQTVKMNKKK